MAAKDSSVDNPPGQASGHASPDPLERRGELQDVFNRRLYHPLAKRLALVLARTPVTPNQVSVAGGLCVVAAGWAYVQPGWPGMIFVGATLHMAWHVLDGADGDLARLTGRESALGETIDGISDYAGHIALYLMLGHLLAGTIGAVAWALMVAAGISRIVQTNHFEVQRRLYQWRVYGTDWVGSSATGRRLAGHGLLQRLLDLYLLLARCLAPAMPLADTELRAGAGDPARLIDARAVIRNELIGPLRRLTPLGSNQRTLVLAGSMLAGSPLWYFIYEASLLNVMLAMSLLRYRSAARKVEHRFGAISRTWR